MRVDQKASFVHFIHPFLFEAETFEARVEAVQRAQWQGRKRLLTVWQMGRSPEGELLPHVARYLNPLGGTPPTHACEFHAVATSIQGFVEQLRAAHPTTTLRSG